MAQKANDLTGKRIGRLLVIESTGKRNTYRYVIWLCKCDCGNYVEVSSQTLMRKNNTKSCGCLRTDVAKKLAEVDSKEKGTRITSLKEDRNMRKDNSSGVRGVSWGKRDRLWIAHMTFKGEKVLFKTFANKQDAISARKEAEEKYFKPILKKYGKEVPSGDKRSE